MMLFTQELNQLQQRQLALRLRSIELRASTQQELELMLRPLNTASGLIGQVGALADCGRGKPALLGLAGLLLGALCAGGRRSNVVERVGAGLAWARLGLRLLNLYAAWRADPASADATAAPPQP